MAIMTTADRLAAAQDALHKLLTGQSPRVIVDQNGERVEFNAANADRLKGYISDLQSQVTNGGVLSRRPMIPVF